MRKTSKLLVVGTLLATTVAPLSVSDQNVLPNGVTPVSYDNRNIVPSPDGKYGVAVPSGINFSSTKTQADASIELVGINGTDLDTTFTNLEVSTTVASTNGFKLTNSEPTGKVGTYKLVYGSDTFESGTSDNSITTNMKLSAKKVDGTATLLTEPTKSGAATDTLTYKFTEVNYTLA